MKPLKTSQMLNFQGLRDGRGGGARTHDPLIKSQLLFQLSYASIGESASIMPPSKGDCKSYFDDFFDPYLFVIFSTFRLHFARWCGRLAGA